MEDLVNKQRLRAYERTANDTEAASECRIDPLVFGKWRRRNKLPAKTPQGRPRKDDEVAAPTDAELKSVESNAPDVPESESIPRANKANQVMMPQDRRFREVRTCKCGMTFIAYDPRYKQCKPCREF